MTQCSYTIKDLHGKGRWACQNEDTHAAGAHALPSNAQGQGDWTSPADTPLDDLSGYGG